MIYQDQQGNIISSLNEWRDAFFSGMKKKHWKEGRSAFEIANYLIHKNGEDKIKEIIKEIVNDEVTLKVGKPEFNVKFDNLGKGREHDVGIFAETAQKKSIFIGIESKVDETFNNTISEVYLKAKTRELNGEKTGAATRVESLLKKNFKVVKPKHFDLRYQLLYSTVGTLEAKEKETYCDISVLFIIVFKTSLYNDVIGKRSHQDYKNFINTLDNSLLSSTPNYEIHKMNIDDRTLYSVYLNVDN
ncbi:hypothetical protein [Flammeovirga sp. EKP202]|uniref:DUF6946 family protein n=1 Tax=Flammeovirga sp. EKP202 TaxID=2770592 RepID=UPI00165F5F80|nr:hypothetical protein [Flammeovirga sp. EKP202]MBD0403701.1 hypothetical protein [Flammeovirga sp. EKP202]